MFYLFSINFSLLPVCLECGRCFLTDCDLSKGDDHNKAIYTLTFPAKKRLNCSVRGVHKLLKIKGDHQLDVSGRACVHSHAHSQQKVS